MIPFGKRPKTLPAVLSRGEVQKIFDALPDNWLRRLIRVTYACGLRVSEVLHLRVADIDRASRACRV
jgi:integrase/recombinase XerD